MATNMKRTFRMTEEQREHIAFLLRNLDVARRKIEDGEPVKHPLLEIATSSVGIYETLQELDEIKV